MGWKRWATFFIVMGMNAIFIYMATHLVDFGNISKRFVMEFEQYKSVFPLMQALGKFAASYLLLLWLYKRNIFFKI